MKHPAEDIDNVNRLYDAAVTVERVWTALQGEDPGITAPGWMRDVHRTMADLRAAIAGVEA